MGQIPSIIKTELIETMRSNPVYIEIKEKDPKIHHKEKNPIKVPIENKVLT